MGSGVRWRPFELSHFHPAPSPRPPALTAHFQAKPARTPAGPACAQASKASIRAHYASAQDEAAFIWAAAAQMKAGEPSTEALPARGKAEVAFAARIIPA